MFVNPLLLAALGLLVDRLLGDPRRLHPLAGFGSLANGAEAIFRWGSPGHPFANRLFGLLAWAVMVLPFVAAAWWAANPLLDLVLLWLALGGKSLVAHARAVVAPLEAGDLDTARQQVAMIVSRDTAQLDSPGVARATIESVLENGNDAIFGALFWFIVAGGAGAVLYRLANTLDAMWGYKDQRRIYFGWAAARIDDVLNYVPARLTAITYALVGKTRSAFDCWRLQAPDWSSPNAGPVMASGAGALKVSLGGTACYHGCDEARPVLGVGPAPCAEDINRAVVLLRRSVLVWLAILIGGGLLLA